MAGISRIKTRKPPEPDASHVIVTWIEWESGLRGSGLEVGDQIVGDAVGAFTPALIASGQVIGAASEGRRWETLGLDAGDRVELHVERDGEALTITGTLVAPALHRDAEGKRALAPEGPALSAKDEFASAWGSWYDRLRDLQETILGGWDATVGYDTRALAERLAESDARVSALAERYPGPFARAVADDMERCRRLLAGEERTLSDADLAWRELGARRAAAVSEAADAAFAALLAELGDALHEPPFPAPRAFEDDATPLVGKVVRLPEVGDRDVLRESRRSWFQIGQSQGVYLLDRTGTSMHPLWAARDRYIEAVDPTFSEQRIAFVGRVEPKLALVSDPRRGITVGGLRTAPLGALVADPRDPARRFFVDFRGDRPGPFAGADRLIGAERPTLADDADPAEVLAVFFRALQVADVDTWRACFATWKVRERFEGRASWTYVDLGWRILSEQEADSVWDAARRRILEEVDAVEVARVRPPLVVHDADAVPAGRVDPEAPARVQRVRATINHIGRDGEGWRTFTNGRLHRRWTLERLDEGPWRITDAWGI